MHERLVFPPITLAAVLILAPILQARIVAPQGAATAQSQSSKIPDLSGDYWRADGKRGGMGASISPSDPNGNHRGKEDDIPYQPWALAKTLTEVPEGGPGADFDHATDPWTLYCEPLGLFRQYMEPGGLKFVQTPDAVYVLHDIGPFYQMVRLNSKHVHHPEPQWWGDSIGWYENGDTLVVDTIDVDAKTWLSKQGHPHSDKLHLIERYKRVDQNTIELDATIDDPGAYTKPFTSHRYFAPSKERFETFQWACSTRDNQKFFDQLETPALPAPAGK
jgi:hypothetical protein